MMNFNEMLLKRRAQISTFAWITGGAGGGREVEIEGKKNLLPSEGKAVLIHMHCLINFARGVDSS